MKALVLNNKVVDVQETEFEVHSSMTWVDCDETVVIGSSYTDGTFSAPEVVTFTAEENLERLRERRNAKLAETDWEIVMHKEKGTNIPTALKTYRQSLRDITDTYSDLDSVVWPTKPE